MVIKRRTFTDKLHAKIVETLNDKTLDHKTLTVDKIVEILRLNNSQYSNLSVKNFTRIVQKALDKINSKSSFENDDRKRKNDIGDENLRKNKNIGMKKLEDDDSDDDSDTPVGKRRKNDLQYKKLRKFEEKHLEEMDSIDKDMTDEKEEAEIDLMKSILRGSYRKNSVGNSGKKIMESDDSTGITNDDGSLNESVESDDFTDISDMDDDKSTNESMETANSTDISGASDNNGVFGEKGGKNKRKNGMKKEKKKNKKTLSNVELETVSGNTDTTSKRSEKYSSKVVKDGPMFKDFGGIGEVVEKLRMEVMVPLTNPEKLKTLKVIPIRGILFNGPPGCGKTKLAHAIANEAGVPFYKIAASELVSGISGGSEENIRELFAKAYHTAPSIVFIDEIDVIGSKRENQQREMERRIVTQLMTCMDESHKAVQSSDCDSNATDKSDFVLVIGATNRPDALDSALRRPGRFDKEITLSVPDEKARLEILSVLTTDLKVQGNIDLSKIASSTPGFVGADLTALVNKAGNLALKRIFDRRKSALSDKPLECDNTEDNTEDWWRIPLSSEEMENFSITMADLEEAATLVQPSSRREGFSSIPDVKWDDVGGLTELRNVFHKYLVDPLKHPDEHEVLKKLDFGFLLYGPPGCGKTLIAKAVANESGANFIHIKGPELLNKYVGESELQVRQLFTRARTCAPCIVFFDEVDALTAGGETEGGGVVSRVLRTLMIELSGSHERRNVFVIGATNRPEVMDPALLRAQRFGKLMHVTLPNADERGSILSALARNYPIDADVDLIAIGRDAACEYFSGADLSDLMEEAAMIAVRERLEEKRQGQSSSSDAGPLSIKKKHFEQALKNISRTVSDEQIQRYYCFEKSLKRSGNRRKPRNCERILEKCNS